MTNAIETVDVTRRLSPEAAEMLRFGIDRQIADAKEKYGISQYAQMWLAGMDMPERGDSKPSKPFSQVELVFACIEKLIGGIAALAPVLSTIDDKIVESGPAYDLFFSSATSWQQFVRDSIGHYALTRDVFWVFTDMAGLVPKEVRVVPGNQMKAITSDGTKAGELIGWEFQGAGGRRERFSLLEVHQWKGFNPDDKFHGAGPLSASANSLNYSFAAALYNANALANAAEPGAILTTTGKLDPDQVRLLRSQFDARHRGAGKAKRTAVLTGGMDVKTIAMKMADMQVAKITEMSDKKICASFGVPPGVVGLITEAQYSHGPSMRDFIFNTIIPLAGMFSGNISSGILSRFSSAAGKGVLLKDAQIFNGSRSLGLRRRAAYRSSRQKALTSGVKLFLWFDCDQHPVVQEAKREETEKVIKYTEAGVPLNQIIEAHDLPYELTDWGNDWWINMGRVPARFTLEAGLEGLTGPSLPEGEPAGEEQPKAAFNSDTLLDENLRASKTPNDEAKRLRLWRSWVISWYGIEKEYQQSMRTFFVRQQRILTKKLRDALSESRSAPSVAKDVNEIVARIIFDLKVEDGKINVINQTFFGKASELGIRQSLTEVLGLKGDELAELTEQVKVRPRLRRALWISSRKITGINRTTKKLVAGQLRTGLEAGEGLKELSVRLKNTLGSNRARAQSIARTQTAGGVGAGRHEGFKAAGVELRTWLTSRDGDVRDAHRQAEKDYAEGIGLYVPFKVGGELLMHPGDPAGSAANIINCRCVELAKRAAGKSFDLARYASLQFYSYTDMQRDLADKQVKEKKE